MSIYAAGLDLDQLKTQAKDLLKRVRSGDPAAARRMSDGHPNPPSTPVRLADCQLVVAREKGFASWRRLKQHVLLGAAVEALDAGDARALAGLLDEHPAILAYRTELETSYFAHATLLHHIAGNPIRCPLPQNIIELATVILERGADPNARCGEPVNRSTTIGLLLTSRQASEAGAALPLVDLLKAHGAHDPIDLGDPALLDSPIWNAGIETARELVRRGARLALPQAAALGRLDVMRELLGSQSVSRDEIERGLLYAALHNRTDAAALLIEHGAKGDVPAPPGRAGAGQTALHNAAWQGARELVAMLLDAGATNGARDLRWNGTAADWAEHGGHPELAALIHAGSAAS